jgi:hypothetical protein
MSVQYSVSRKVQMMLTLLNCGGRECKMYTYRPRASVGVAARVPPHFPCRRCCEHVDTGRRGRIFLSCSSCRKRKTLLPQHLGEATPGERGSPDEAVREDAAPWQGCPQGAARADTAARGGRGFPSMATSGERYRGHARLPRRGCPRGRSSLARPPVGSGGGHESPGERRGGPREIASRGD